MEVSVIAKKPPFVALLYQQLAELLCCLLQLGREAPQYLVLLSEIAQPSLPQDMRIPILGKMFDDLPKMFTQLPVSEVYKVIESPPNDAVALRLLISLRDVAFILDHASYLQLLHLTNNALPNDSTLESQIAYITKLQQVFLNWDAKTLKSHNAVLIATPLHLERQQLLQMDPTLPWDIISLLLELLKMPIAELLVFRTWFCSLSSAQIELFTKLLKVETTTLIEIKRRLSISNFKQPTSTLKEPTAISDGFASSSIAILPTPASSSMGSALNATASTSVESSVVEPLGAFDSKSFTSSYDFDVFTLLDPGDTISPCNPSSPKVEEPPEPFYYSPTGSSFSLPSTSSAETPSPIRLKIVREPPSKTVYQRILRPYPSVMIEMDDGGQSLGTGIFNLFVEASLLRSDSEVQLPQCLEGNRVVRISQGVFATFKKLKILSTSQRQGTLFRLKFTLKKYVGSSFAVVSNATVISTPIEVFSHTQYLTDRQKGPGDVVQATTTEVLPSSGSVNTRVVILGSNFVNSPNLRVRFGTVEIPATFHEQGTLICTTPPKSPDQSSVQVSVSNDGHHYGATTASFTYR